MAGEVLYLSDGSRCEVGEGVSLADVQSDLRCRGLRVVEVKQVGYEDKVLRDAGTSRHGGGPMTTSTVDPVALVRAGMDATESRLGDRISGLARYTLQLGDALRARGFEERAAAIWGPDGHPLWPTRQDHATGRALTASMAPAYKTAWLHWLQRATTAGSTAAYRLLPGDEQKALSEGSDPAGGFLVPAELAAQILTLVRERSVVRQSARTIPTTRDVLHLGRLDLSAGWQGGEVDTAGTETDASVAQLSIAIFKARVKVAVSNDLLADQPSLDAWLSQAAGQQLALLEDQAFIAGTGLGEPLGFAVDATVPTVDVEGTTGNTISNTTVNAGSAPKLITLEGALPDAYASRARWFMRGTTHAAIGQLVRASGGPYFSPDVVNAAGERLLLGHPVSRSSALDADGSDGARVVALCDPSQYLIATRNTVSMRVLREPLAETDETLIVITERVGGVLADAQAAVVGLV